MEIQPHTTRKSRADEVERRRRRRTDDSVKSTVEASVDYSRIRHMERRNLVGDASPLQLLKYTVPIQPVSKMNGAYGNPTRQSLDMFPWGKTLVHIVFVVAVNF